MPIKLPKGFQRRKSSGAALEELPNPPEPSFRVFERHEGIKSFDGGNNSKRMSNGRPLSAGHLEDDNLFVDGRPNINSTNRGSGGTNNSASSRGHNDNSSSSARFSSTSTLPSSTDLPLDENSYSNANSPYDIAPPPVPEASHSALRAAGRALSFGRKKAEHQASVQPPRSVVEHVQSDSFANFNRPRAMTESSYASESTATPPKLLDGGLDVDDGFGSMFENFGKRQSSVLEAPPTLGGANTESPENTSPAGSRMLTKSYFGERQFTPSPVLLDGSPRVQESPRSWASDDSQDGLMGANSQRAAEALSFYKNSSPNPASGSGPSHVLSKSRTTPLPEPNSPSNRRQQQRPPSVAGGGLRRSSVYASKRDSARSSEHLHDEDARLVMDSLSASQRLNRTFGTCDSYEDEAYNPAASLIPNSSYPSSPYANSDPQKMATPGQHSPVPLFDSSDRDFSATPWRQGSPETTPRAKKIDIVQHEERSMFDASPPSRGRSAPMPPLPKTQPPPKIEMQNKVMTPAQFEKYRKEQEMRKDQYFQKDESDEEGDDYEDDDEIERSKHLARERRKQEANLSVYRQQMMKVTGEQPSDLPSARPAMDRSSMSAPNLANRSSPPTFNFDKPAEGGKSSDDEDEDVPLGVLAAHGFPSKTRPPTATGSHVQYKSESYPPPPMSVAGTSAAGGPRPVPPFAKYLPQDPYYGAGLVNPSNREGLSFSQGGPASIAGGSRPSIAPGGLVGVIAGEERAKAARRGSPNAQGNYGTPLPPGMQMAMPPGMPPMMSPGEQATVQMSEQMNQMMQMQMQWMQQMQQMMGGGMQPGQQPPFMMPPQQQQMMMNAGMLAPPGQPQRPTSASAPGTPAGSQQAQQRAMSVVGPTSTPQWQPLGNRMSGTTSMMSGALNGPVPGYAPSMAPSERSNVGMPTRYRPISIAPADEHGPRASSRASTFTTGMHQPETPRRSSTLSAYGDRQSKLSLRPVSHAPPKNPASDDDDEEGWEEMKQKREQKKSTWRLKKQRDEHGALDLYDYPEQ